MTEKIEADTVEDAKEELAANPAALASFAFGESDSLAVCINGLGCGYFPEYPPLAVLVMDMMNWEPLMAFDEIQERIIDSYMPHRYKEGEGLIPDPTSDPITSNERQAIDIAISCLQSGIDKLRAYEAERLKAQP